jgi:hypothetical protein
MNSTSAHFMQLIPLYGVRGTVVPASLATVLCDAQPQIPHIHFLEGGEREAS